MRQFVASVEAAALGVKVVKGVRPDQQLVKVVNDELVRLMGGQQEDLVDPKDGPQVRLRSCTWLHSSMCIKRPFKQGNRWWEYLITQGMPRLPSSEP